jgi:membrane protein YqaA with SNARE-associated domain
LPIAFLVLAVVLAVLAWSLRSYVAPEKLAGYPGVFFLALFGAVSMVLPVPGLVSVCGLSVALNPFALGVLSGLGESLGESSAYAVGYGGDTVFDRFAFYRKLRPIVRGWMEKRGTLVVFLVSVIPNPIVDVVGIAAGSVHFPFRRFLLIVFIGKTIKGLLVAYTCHYGVTLLPWVS